MLWRLDGGIDHVLIDEAQDVTPMQWRMLRRRGSQASWTIVGDLAQSSWPDLDEVGRAVRDLIGNAPHRDFRLSVNYRSPAEVFNLASQVVKPHYPDADLPRALAVLERWRDRAQAMTPRGQPYPERRSTVTKMDPGAGSPQPGQGELFSETACYEHPASP